MTTPTAGDAGGQDRWPWAVGAAGVLLAVLGLWRLLGHLSRQKVTIDPTADLPTVVAASDQVCCHESTRALGDPDIDTRVHFRTARNSRSGPRAT